MSLIFLNLSGMKHLSFIASKNQALIPTEKANKILPPNYKSSSIQSLASLLQKLVHKKDSQYSINYPLC